MTQEPLAARATAFALEVQQSLNGVLPGETVVVSRAAPDNDRFIVQPQGASSSQRRVPIFVDGRHLADLGVTFYLEMDRTGLYLKTVRSDLVLHSVLDRTPLTRLEYRADMRSAPISHWQFHAERGSFTHLLAAAHQVGRVGKPHDLSSLHLPVGGERFRPCLEDMLQFLVQECGVDHLHGWQEVVSAGRASWRRRQLAAAVRDVPDEAARVLGELGWSATSPVHPTTPPKTANLTSW